MKNRLNAALRIGMAMFMALFATNFMPIATAQAATIVGRSEVIPASSHKTEKTEIAPSAQIESEITCEAAGSYSVTAVAGVTYKSGGVTVEGNNITVATAGDVVVTAEYDDELFELAPGAKDEFTLKFKAANNCSTEKTEIAPSAQIESEITCEAAGSYSVTAVAGVTYKVGDTVVTGSNNLVTTPGNVIVTAEYDATLYELENGAKDEFTLRFQAPNNCDGSTGNNGTLKVHAAGSPAGFEDNEPKVCSFNFEGSGFDPYQEGYIVIEPQGGSDPEGAPAGPFEVGPADENGYFETMYFNDEDGPVVVNGTYKATLYGKDIGGAIDLTDEKAKSKVFKVDCQPPVTVDVPENPTVVVTSQPCVAPGTTNGTLTVRVTNPDEEGEFEPVTYSVALGGTVKEVTLADGESELVIFTGLSTGLHTVTVTGDDETTASTSATLVACVVDGGRGGAVLDAVDVTYFTPSQNRGAGAVLAATTDTLPNTGAESVSIGTLMALIGASLAFAGTRRIQKRQLAGIEGK